MLSILSFFTNIDRGFLMGWCKAFYFSRFLILFFSSALVILPLVILWHSNVLLVSRYLHAFLSMQCLHFFGNVDSGGFILFQCERQYPPINAFLLHVLFPLYTNAAHFIINGVFLKEPLTFSPNSLLIH